MTLEYGHTPQEEHMLFLAYSYLCTLALFHRENCSRDEVFKYLIDKDKAEGIKNAKYAGFTDEQIKTILKQAADAEKEHLAIFGITPEELY